MNAYSGRQLNSSFSKGILALLDRVEYRRINTPEDLEDIGRLRQKSYENKELIISSEFGSHVDQYDFDPYCHIFGMYIDEHLISTIRLHLATADHLHGPTAHFFPECAKSLTANGKCYIDPSRFAADQDKMWEFPAIPFLTLRLAAAASEFFNASHCMSFVRSDVASFYRRSFGAIDMEPPQYVRGYSVPVVLLGARIEDIRERIETRFPFFQSTNSERRMLFAPESELQYAPLSILSTARRKMGEMNDMSPIFNPQEAIAIST